VSRDFPVVLKMPAAPDIEGRAHHGDDRAKSKKVFKSCEPTAPAFKDTLVRSQMTLHARYFLFWDAKSRRPKIVRDSGQRIMQMARLTKLSLTANRFSILTVR